MEYKKPEITYLANAVASIQNNLDKDEQEAQDGNFPIDMRLASVAAYQADE
jgi:hypothetical protein